MYTISFPAFERENIVLMAVSMARGKPVERVNPPLVASP
jgi:hypothetical protein